MTRWTATEEESLCIVTLLPSFKLHGRPYILRTTTGHRDLVPSRLSCPSVPYTTTRFARSSCLLLHVILAETSAASTSGISA
jgi:hypothetical protein